MAGLRRQAGSGVAVFERWIVGTR